MKSMVLGSEKDLEKLITKILPLIKNNKVIYLQGDLGTGKTTFTKYLAKVLGSIENVSSPTFLLHHEYALPNSKLNHLDLYRIDSVQELIELDLKSLSKNNTILVIEWADKFTSYLNTLFSNIIVIEFLHVDNSTKRLVNVRQIS